MSWFARLRNIFRPLWLDGQLDAELKFHLDETIDRLVSEGFSEKQAKRQARLRLGNYTLQKERTREMNVSTWIEAAWTDLRYGLRQLKLNPGFAAVAILSLALGIGANAAIFQLIDALRLHGLPVRDPGQLATVTPGKNYHSSGSYDSRNYAFSYEVIEALKRHQQAFSDVISFWPNRMNLSTGGRARYAEGMLVSTNFFDVLGVTPMAGAGISKEDDKAACPSAAALLSYSFWQREFGGDLQEDQVPLALGVNWHVFGFLAALAFTTCVLFGLAPAIRASGVNPASAMRGSRTSTASREKNGLRRALVISQVALSVVLLVTALLFATNLRRLLQVNVGFDSHQVLVASVTASGSAFSNPVKRDALFRELEPRVHSLPGVSSSAIVLMPPFSGSGWNNSVHADDDPARTNGKLGWFNCVGAGYFSTMGTPLLSGRDVSAHDDLSAPKVAIVNQAFARRYFKGQNPVGRSFRVEARAGSADLVYQIIGLVADTRYNNLGEEQRAIAFFPMTQHDLTNNDGRQFVIRGRGSLDSLQVALQREVMAVNPNLLVDFHVLDVQIERSVLRERLMANLSVAFGILAASLSALGLYGVMSYLVARRRTEIGVRVALGASRGNVYGLVVRDSALMVMTGLVVGVGVYLALAKYAESLLFDLKAKNPVILAVGVALLTITAMAATLLPASRAARVEPITALRED